MAASIVACAKVLAGLIRGAFPQLKAVTVAGDPRMVATVSVPFLVLTPAETTMEVVGSHIVRTYQIHGHLVWSRWGTRGVTEPTAPTSGMVTAESVAAWLIRHDAAVLDAEGNGYFIQVVDTIGYEPAQPLTIESEQYAVVALLRIRCKNYEAVIGV
jgi:hypothetical protein